MNQRISETANQMLCFMICLFVYSSIRPFAHSSMTRYARCRLRLCVYPDVTVFRINSRVGV